MDEAAHAEFFLAGTSWVAVDAQDRPLGFLCANRFDAVLHR
jgi:hypothetical protein